MNWTRILLSWQAEKANNIVYLHFYSNISDSALRYKYTLVRFLCKNINIAFPLCFFYTEQTEPIDGYLCRNCWQNVFLFHEFYVRVESVYEKNNKNNIVALTLDVKEENVEEVTMQSVPMVEFSESDSSLKCELVFSDDTTTGRNFNWN